MTEKACIFLLILAIALGGCASAKITPVAETLPVTETPSETVTPQPTSTPNISGMILEECRLEGSQAKALCGDLEVPENRALPEGRKIKIHVVVVKAISRTPVPDPVFLLAGGPGQSAVETFSGLISAFARINEKHDIVMVDQRGTGKSGALQCADQSAETKPTPEFTPEVVDADIPMEDQLAEIDTCLAGWQDMDLTQYTTDIAMQDLDDVRYALGYESINLLGISYGTRAALAYQSLYPNQVRSLVLDGVAPLGWAIGATLRADAERALDLIISRCQRNADCNQQFPDLKRELVDLLASARDEPVEVTIADPVTAELRPVRVSPLMISATVRLMTYSDYQTALIPLMIHQAAQGDYSMIASQYIQLTTSFSGKMNYGMYYSVWCYEDLPKIPPGGELGEFYFDPQIETSRAICERWPKINRSVDLPAYSNPDVPVLLISGEADPVTPPANAELIHKQFPQSLSLVLADMGHNNYFTGCVPEIVHDFIETASVENLDIACLQDVTPQSFFLNPVGPAPRK